MSRVYIKTTLLLIILAGSIMGIWYATRPDPVIVTLYTVVEGPVEATVANTRVGTVRACRRSMLAPTVGGEVSQLTVREGDRVEAGQILLEIWNEDLKAQLQLAEAKKVTAQSRSKEACTRAAGSERELNRLRKLLKDKLISEVQVDQALTEFETNEASCDASRASVIESDATIKVTTSALERTIVRAPFDGIVAEVNAELGEYVTPSPLGIQTLPAIDLIDMSCLYVSAPIDEVDAPPIQIGMKACVSLDAFPERRCNGTVQRIAPYVLDREKQARTVEVEVILSDPADMEGLLPGYSADIEIALASKDRVLRIPTESILENNQVYLYEQATGTIQLRNFEPGLANWNYTEVLGGLEVGDRIVVSIGREGVEAGARVIPEKSTTMKQK